MGLKLQHFMGIQSYVGILFAKSVWNVVITVKSDATYNVKNNSMIGTYSLVLQEHAGLLGTEMGKIYLYGYELVDVGSYISVNPISINLQ